MACLAGSSVAIGSFIAMYFVDLAYKKTVITKILLTENREMPSDSGKKVWPSRWSIANYIRIRLCSI